MQNSKLVDIHRWWRVLCLQVSALAAAIGLIITLSGCVSSLLGPGAYSNLSVEQIEALQKNQMDVYACSTISGPPPSGRIVYVAVPRLDKKADIRFGENCSVR